MWKCVRTSLRADVTFSTQTNPSTETLCWLLTDWPCEWDRAGGESTQNANHLVATDWITPLFMQNSPERPAVGICQGRRSCHSFIRGHNGGLSAASHHLTPGLPVQWLTIIWADKGFFSTTGTLPRCWACGCSVWRAGAGPTQPGENAPARTKDLI